jgi:hypothetical protein
MEATIYRRLSTEAACPITLARYMLGEFVQPNIAARIERTAKQLGVVLPRLQPVVNVSGE